LRVSTTTTIREEILESIGHFAQRTLVAHREL
jgi:hypothetical protein